ncbi:MAG: hypothetical protein ABI528_08285 [bacterium]
MLRICSGRVCCLKVYVSYVFVIFAAGMYLYLKILNTKIQTHSGLCECITSYYEYFTRGNVPVFGMYKRIAC